MFPKDRKYSARLLCGAAVGALAMFSSIAHAEEIARIEIPSQPLSKALGEFAAKTKRAVLVTPDLTLARVSRSVSEDDPETALVAMLDGTGLTYRRDGDTFLIVKAAADPQSQGAAGDGAEVEALIVTAQKREEDIQDVPIAISAFTQEDLTRSQVAGGPDLMTQVPNMTFTKTNFSSYSIQIRGIGTQAISATVDPAVAVAFNNTPFVRNRFFEQEFYDLQRVEVLRGPQGTLYGRNATAGVVNIISAKPSFTYASRLSADVGNYKSTRVEGMVNIPLVDDVVALRVAGAWTKRDGYATNEVTGNPIDGRDLWSSRVSLRLAPTDAIDVNLIWEHFQEDDDRLRSGKQLCKTDEPTEVGGLPVDHFYSLPNAGQGGMFPGVAFSQGCSPSSLYSPDSFQTPQGLSLPYYYPLSFIFLPAALQDPYVSRTQSHDLRVIESTVDPEYRAKSDVFELQASFDLTDTLSLSSETSYSRDTVFAMQDFNRFTTAPGAWSQEMYDRNGVEQHRENVLVDGVFCDPQIGCSDRLVAVDLSTAKSTQFSQELRLASDYAGKFNFSLGANYLRYDTEDKYYVFINSLGLISAISPYGRQGPLPAYDPRTSDNSECLLDGLKPGEPGGVYPLVRCTYIDPNPIGSLNDQGHNYFLSKNPYKLISYAVFGEAYYQIADNLKVTGGLRWTVDKKEAPRVPSWLLAANSVGYPVAEVIEQEWSKPTGRLTIDWKPDLGFTDQTLLYASLAHGYKAGGANPPNYTYVFYSYEEVTDAGSQQSATRPKVFDPEYVNAIEVGAKNTLLDGSLTLNLAGFYYDYKGYQISEIVDRSAFNRNFDAEVWGLEIEADWRPLENLRLGFKGGYENTRIADGMRAVDLMDRTAGHDDWVVVRPFPTFAANCVLPKWLFAGSYVDFFTGELTQTPIALGGVTGGNPGACELAYVLGQDPVTAAPYVDLTKPHDPITPGLLSMLSFFPDYPGWDPNKDYGANHGEGFYKELGGNELPNAPHFTATVTADYTLPLPSDWLMTLHTDLYYQSEAWTRVFNMEGYDKLKAYTNVNLAAIFTNEDAGWKVMAYVKNVFDRDSITGSFLNSDDTGLTTNVFLTEPRLYGLRVTKEWSGASPFGTFGARHDGPYPLTVELGGQVARIDAPYSPVEPSFVGAFDPAVYQPGQAQNRDLDWGDERSVRVTYRPGGGAWSYALGYRFGDAANGRTTVFGEQATEAQCVFGPANPQCANNPEKYYLADTNWASSDAVNREEFEMADFKIGREFGLGRLQDSTLALGLSYARFKSATDVALDGIPDDSVAPNFLNDKYASETHHRYKGILQAEREFEGFGPELSWDASLALLGSESSGHVDFDWSLATSVLFGKQTASVTGTEETRFYEVVGFQNFYGVTAPTSVAPLEHIDMSRSNEVTVPSLSGSLGLSYNIDRFSIGAGYRYERYFDALDAGSSTPWKYDRTIDGPYFKLSVGFGG